MIVAQSSARSGDHFGSKFQRSGAPPRRSFVASFRSRHRATCGDHSISQPSIAKRRQSFANDFVAGLLQGMSRFDSQFSSAGTPRRAVQLRTAFETASDMIVAHEPLPSPGRGSWSGLREVLIPLQLAVCTDHAVRSSSALHRRREK